jgi:transposase-like protein
MQMRRRFSKEFKREAVQMAKGADLSIKQIAGDLGIHTNVLSRWCREQERDGRKAFPGQGVSRDEEVARLKTGVCSRNARTGFFKRRGGLLCQGHAARYAMIAHCRRRFRFA